jgi:hypothetical protein
MTTAKAGALQEQSGTGAAFNGARKSSPQGTNFAIKAESGIATSWLAVLADLPLPTEANTGEGTSTWVDNLPSSSRPAEVKAVPDEEEVVILRHNLPSMPQALMRHAAPVFVHSLVPPTPTQVSLQSPLPPLNPLCSLAATPSNTLSTSPYPVITHQTADAGGELSN